MFRYKTLVWYPLIFVFLMNSATPDDSGDLTAYDMLERFNFPRGILPQGVKGFDLNDDGSFAVHFDGSCQFQVEGGYSLSYKSTITGKVSFGSLKSLQGVSVKVLFVWFSISEVSRRLDELDFHVGPLSASFELSNFIDSPQCGCGFDCVNAISDS